MIHLLPWCSFTIRQKEMSMWNVVQELFEATAMQYFRSLAVLTAAF